MVIRVAAESRESCVLTFLDVSLITCIDSLINAAITTNYHALSIFAVWQDRGNRQHSESRLRQEVRPGFLF